MSVAPGVYTAFDSEALSNVPSPAVVHAQPVVLLLEPAMVAVPAPQIV